MSSMPTYHELLKRVEQLKEEKGDESPNTQIPSFCISWNSNCYTIFEKNVRICTFNYGNNVKFLPFIM